MHFVDRSLVLSVLLDIGLPRLDIDMSKFLLSRQRRPTENSYLVRLLSLPSGICFPRQLVFLDFAHLEFSFALLVRRKIRVWVWFFDGSTIGDLTRNWFLTSIPSFAHTANLNMAAHMNHSNGDSANSFYQNWSVLREFFG